MVSGRNCSLSFAAVIVGEKKVVVMPIALGKTLAGNARRAVDRIRDQHVIAGAADGEDRKQYMPDSPDGVSTVRAPPSSLQSASSSARVVGVPRRP